jgi:hypothetical protein
MLYIILLNSYPQGRVKTFETLRDRGVGVREAGDLVHMALKPLTGALIRSAWSRVRQGDLVEWLVCIAERVRLVGEYGV